MSGTPSPYLAALAGLVARDVPFVLVGVGAINFYAKDAASTVATRDLDLLVAPTVGALRATLESLHAAGYELSVGGEPFVDVSDEIVLAGVLRAGAAIRAIGPEGAQLDVTSSIAGYHFDELADDAVPFRVGDVEIRVGRLEKLLRSKELANRPKDRELLRMYRATFDESPGEG